MKTTKLFSCLFGSRLYGTSTPTSDIDIKNVVLVDLDELLLGRGVKNSFKKTNNVKNVRNSVDDVDEEFIPVQVFARDFMEGQTYALELAFAMEGTHAEQSFYFPSQAPYTLEQYLNRNSSQPPLIVEFVRELRTKFLTSNIKAMMGYVVNQASLYSFKGERLNAVRDFIKLLENRREEGADFNEAKLSAYDHNDGFREDVAAMLEKYPKYFRKDTYDIGGDRMMPCFYLLEKCMPWTNTMAHTYTVVKNLEKKYGTRADAASETNVDWKATMHALRIVDEGVRLLATHELSFPFPTDYVEKLLSIKRGERPLKPVTDELASKLDSLKDLEKTTTLPTANEVREEFEVWLKAWMRRFYGV